jgi:glycosyltransferase involved in cell wall biosynthesis
VPRRLRLLEVMGNAIVGGMENSVLRLVERLPKDRFEITVMAPFESRCTEALRSMGSEVLVVPMPEDMLWSSAQLATSMVEACGIDVLHAHLPNAHMLAGLAGRLAGRPVVATVHGRQLAPLDLEAHRFFGTHVCVVCRHSYYHAIGMGVERSRLDCVPNGVDTALFRPDAADLATPLRAALGLEASALLVGFVARLSQEKGPELFMRCAAGVHQQHPDAHFVVVGDGPMHGQMVDMAERTGLSRHLHFAGVRGDMPQIYPQFDVLVSSSHSEAMPLAVMEAMASGVPVVATKVGGIADLVEQASTGWLVGPRDTDGLAGQTSLLLGSPEMRREMGLRSRQRAVSHFDLGLSIDAMAAMLVRLGGHGSGAQKPAGGADGTGLRAHSMAMPQGFGAEAMGSFDGAVTGLADVLESGKANGKAGAKPNGADRPGQVPHAAG